MKINLYDFDKTIYDGDSSVDFFLFNLKKQPLLFFHIFKMIYVLIKYKLKFIDKTEMKIVIFSYLKKVKNIDERVDMFWEKNKKKIKSFYLLKKQLDGVKVLGNGKLEKKITIQASKFSASALEKIKEAGSKAEVI